MGPHVSVAPAATAHMAKVAASGSYSKVPSEDAGTLKRRNVPAAGAAGGAESSDSEDEQQLTERDIARKKWVYRLNWIWTKISAAFWVAAACGTIWYTNFFRVIWESPLVSRSYFYLGLACLGFNMTTLMYLAIWCSAIKGIKDPWDTTHKQAVPAMAVVGF